MAVVTLTFRVAPPPKNKKLYPGLCVQQSLEESCHQGLETGLNHLIDSDATRSSYAKKEKGLALAVRHASIYLIYILEKFCSGNPLLSVFLYEVSFKHCQMPCCIKDSKILLEAGFSHSFFQPSHTDKGLLFACHSK